MLKDTLENIQIFGIPIDIVDMKTALYCFDEMMQEPGCSLIITPNSQIVMNAMENERLADVIKIADLVIPDGIGLLKAAKMLGKPFKERVTGIDFSYEALKRIAKMGKSVYLFGSKPGVAKEAAKRLQKKIPGLKVSGCCNGYFKKEDERFIVSDINASGASFLLVALGSPKQELFMAEHCGELSNVRVAIGVGGSLDVWSGRLHRAPKIFIKCGMEWFYRMLQEPSRIKKTMQIPKFLLKVWKYKKENLK